MEDAIEALQDKILYETGYLVIMKLEDINATAKNRVIKEVERKIANLKAAQKILEQYI